MKNANVRAREHIKMFLGEYLAFCPTNKYHVLEYIMKNVIFENKVMRISFLDEILLNSSYSAERCLMSYYLLINQKSLAHMIYNNKDPKDSTDR